MKRNRSFKQRCIQVARVIRAGMQNFVRNATLAVAAIAVMVITLSILLFSVIANATFSHTIEQITDRIDVSVYLNDDVTTDQRNQLISDLEQIDNVQSVEYLSKDDALRAYQEQNRDNPELLAAISETDNPLPASLRIKPEDPNRIDEIRDFIEQPEIRELQSDETSYSGDRKEAIDNITEATSFFREVGVVGVVVFALVSMLIIFNTIRMAIFNRRDELTIMRLLGAGNWYIKGPFVVETVVYGVVAAILSMVFIEGLFAISSSAFGASTLGLLDIEFANDYFARNFWVIFLSQLFLGMFIGGFSSLVATRRYLKFRSSK